MGAAFVDDPSWRLVAEASEAAGRDIGHLLLEADASELVETRNAQLGTFVHSMVALDALRRHGLEPDAVAGHSLGELSALCAAGVVSFADGVRLVVERGESMQACTTQRVGTMAAVLGLDEETVTAACAGVDGEVWVANINAPGQVVIAGDPDDVAAAGAAAKDAGAKRVMPLEVSGAFHTAFMAPAAERLAEAVGRTSLRDADVPVVANVDAAVHRSASDWPELLDRQLVSPVRWAASVDTLVGLGAQTFVEVGPGAVLTGTIKRIAGDVERRSVTTPDQVGAAVAALGASA